MANPLADDFYRIGSVAALTGIAVERLRAWERRHDFSPAHKHGRTRFYSADQLEKLKKIKHLIDRGQTVSSVIHLTEQQLDHYRQELASGGGLSSYPHPRSMPEFWELPNASMGLSTPAAIYQARFAKYLENRGMKEKASGKVWCFIGDGEADEPEVLGTINIAAREKLDNLILVVNCNLQRLDGPVRGNGKIIQELERTFRGADWNVLKVIWGGGWDGLLARDHEGVLQRRMDECLDGDYQMYSVLPGDVQREHWVEGNPKLEQMMNSLTDEEVRAIKRGGQDQKKIYAAFAKASAAQDKPTVILVKTVKGDSMGAQGKNTAHQY